MQSPVRVSFFPAVFDKSLCLTVALKSRLKGRPGQREAQRKKAEREAQLVLVGPSPIDVLAVVAEVSDRRRQRVTTCSPRIKYPSK